MAVELFSENCGVSTMSPRISFSHDFSQSDVIPVEQTPFRRSNSSGLNSSFDFDVNVRESLEQESSSADELFSDGKMLPTEIIKKKIKAQSQSQLQLHQTQQVPHTQTVRENTSPRETTKKNNEGLKEIKHHQQQQHNDEVDEKQSSNNNNPNKSFWGFKRSSSCGSGGYGRRSLCPLPLLSRSNSTGSAPTTSSVNNKRMTLNSKEGPNNNNNTMKQKHSPTTTTRPYHQKPPLKKIHGPYVHNGVRVNPVVINVPSANLFGLGSIFSSSSNRDKSKKK